VRCMLTYYTLHHTSQKTGTNRSLTERANPVSLIRTHIGGPSPPSTPAPYGELTNIATTPNNLPCQQADRRVEGVTAEAFSVDGQAARKGVVHLEADHQRPGPF